MRNALIRYGVLLFALSAQAQPIDGVPYGGRGYIRDVDRTPQPASGVLSEDVTWVFSSNENDPLAITEWLEYTYHRGEVDVRNHDDWFPLMPQGSACENGGTFPACNFEKGNIQTLNFQTKKMGIGQAGAEWSFDLECAGPGDCLGLQVSGRALSATPAGSDEGFSAITSRTQDYPVFVPQGTTTAALNAGATSLFVSQQFAERVSNIGEHGYIVFNDSTAPGYSRVDGNDGLATLIGGFNNYDHTQRTWTVNVSAEIPSSVRYDSAIGWTGHCMALDRSQRTSGADGAFLVWLPILFGPTDTAAGTGAATVCGSPSCGAAEFETYHPAIPGANVGALGFNLVANEVWTQYATNSSVDDGIIAPCEIVSHPVFALESTGKIAGSTQIVLRKPAKAGRTIAAGESWVYAQSGWPGQFRSFTAITFNNFSKNQPQYLASSGCEFSSGCSSLGAAYAVNASLQNGVFSHEHGFLIQGATQTAGYLYRPWETTGLFSEQGMTVGTQINATHWGTADADRVQIHNLHNPSDGNDMALVYDTADRRFLTVGQRVDNEVHTILAARSVTTDGFAAWAEGGTTCDTACQNLGGVCQDAWDIQAIADEACGDASQATNPQLCQCRGAE